MRVFLATTVLVLASTVLAHADSTTAEDSSDVAVVGPKDGLTQQAIGPHRFGAWTYLTAGAALAFVAAGTALIAVDGPTCSPEPLGSRCPERRSTVASGLISLGVGAATASLAGWMYWTDHIAVRASITPSASGASAHISVLF